MQQVTGQPNQTRSPAPGAVDSGVAGNDLQLRPQPVLSSEDPSGAGHGGLRQGIWGSNRAGWLLVSTLPLANWVQHLTSLILCLS